MKRTSGASPLRARRLSGYAESHQIPILGVWRPYLLSVMVLTAAIYVTVEVQTTRPQTVLIFVFATSICWLSFLLSNERRSASRWHAFVKQFVSHDLSRGAYGAFTVATAYAAYNLPAQWREVVSIVGARAIWLAGCGSAVAIAWTAFGRLPWGDQEEHHPRVLRRVLIRKTIGVTLMLGIVCIGGIGFKDVGTLSSSWTSQHLTTFRWLLACSVVIFCVWFAAFVKARPNFATERQLRKEKARRQRRRQQQFHATVQQRRRQQRIDKQAVKAAEKRAGLDHIENKLDAPVEPTSVIPRSAPSPVPPAMHDDPPMPSFDVEEVLASLHADAE